MSNNMSNPTPTASPLTKIKDGVKKTSKQVEEEILKAKQLLVKKKARQTASNTGGDDLDDNGYGTFSSPVTQIDSGSDAVDTTADAGASKESGLGVGGDGSSSSNVNETTIDKDEESATLKDHTDQPSSTPNTSSSTMVVVELFVITMISISTVYHTWWYRLEIASSQIPFIVAIHWSLIAYFIGRSSTTNEKVVVVSIDDDDYDEEDASTNQLTTQEEQQEEVVKKSSSSFTKEEKAADSRTKQIIRRIPMGRRHYSKIKTAYIARKESSSSSSSSPMEDFFTNLKPVGLTTNITQNKPISKGLMNRLLKNSDFRRRKSVTGEIDMAEMTESCLQIQNQEEVGEEEGGELNIDIGTAPMVNMRASKLERDFDYVEPLCKFRGMDMFVGDFPEKEIWKQPLLLKNGLRDTPTLIGNMMLPQGNLVSYLQMPEWFDDWDNIPEETADDPPDMKAFKRFFAGDLEYQRKRAKIVPMVVKAPYVVKMMSPTPSELTIHTPRHPVSINKVNKVVDPLTGETTAAAVMELGVDLYTSAAIGRIINIVLPHLGSITIDLAVVIHPPWGAEGAEAEEPSACVGVWRVDQVDFVSCAQLLEKPIEVVEEEIKDIMKSFVMESEE